jgi:hypothetical protein
MLQVVRTGAHARYKRQEGRDGLVLCIIARARYEKLYHLKRKNIQCGDGGMCLEIAFHLFEALHRIVISAVLMLWVLYRKEQPAPLD